MPEIHVDLELSIDDVTSELEGLLRHFEPCGVGNPVAGTARARRALGVRRRGRLSHDGVKLRLGACGGRRWTRSRGAPRTGSPELDAGGPVDVVFRVERDEWQGEPRVQAKVTDFRV